jgi:ribosome recycling factor
MTKEILEEARKDFAKIEADFRREISKFRTGRASVAILDGVQVEYYGVPTPINQLATLGVPEANMIIIQPWDHNIVNDIDKAIRSANLGISPISDGKIIRLPIPPLDEERRLEIIKTLKRYLEERKTIIRNSRREYREMVKAMKDDGEVSEDEERRFYDDLQASVDEAIEKIEKLEQEKQKHILED